jgi:hypothetical protein
MIDCAHYEHEDVDFQITQEMRERAKPDIEFLKNCGLPHTIEGAWVLQDLFDYLTCIKNLCDKMKLSFDLYYKDCYWEARAYNPKVGKGITFPVETGMNKAPLFSKAIRELAIAINEAWVK